jgi:hypothetical protein
VVVAVLAQLDQASGSTLEKLEKAKTFTSIGPAL